MVPDSTTFHFFDNRLPRQHKDHADEISLVQTQSDGLDEILGTSISRSQIGLQNGDTQSNNVPNISKSISKIFSFDVMNESTLGKLSLNQVQTFISALDFFPAGSLEVQSYNSYETDMDSLSNTSMSETDMDSLSDTSMSSATSDGRVSSIRQPFENNEERSIESFQQSIDSVLVRERADDGMVSCIHHQVQSAMSLFDNTHDQVIISAVGSTSIKDHEEKFVESFQESNSINGGDVGNNNNNKKKKKKKKGFIGAIKKAKRFVVKLRRVPGLEASLGTEPKKTVQEPRKAKECSLSKAQSSVKEEPEQDYRSEEERNNEEITHNDENKVKDLSAIDRDAAKANILRVLSDCETLVTIQQMLFPESEGTSDEHEGKQSSFQAAFGNDAGIQSETERPVETSLEAAPLAKKAEEPIVSASVFRNRRREELKKKFVLRRMQSWSNQDGPNLESRRLSNAIQKTPEQIQCAGDKLAETPSKPERPLAITKEVAKTARKAEEPIISGTLFASPNKEEMRNMHLMVHRKQSWASHEGSNLGSQPLSSAIQETPKQILLETPSDPERSLKTLNRVAAVAKKAEEPIRSGTLFASRRKEEMRESNLMLRRKCSW